MMTLEDRMANLERLVMQPSAPILPQRSGVGDIPGPESLMSPISTSNASSSQTQLSALGQGQAPLPDKHGTFESQHNLQAMDLTEKDQTAARTSPSPPVTIDFGPRARVTGDTLCSFPPISGGLFLLQEFLEDFNKATPLFEREAISKLFHECYKDRPDEDLLSWIAMKLVLAIAHRLRAMSPLGVGQDSENAELYLQECLTKVPKILMYRSSLLLCQCYLAFAIALSTSPNSLPAAMFVTMALRVLEDLRLDHVFEDNSDTQLQRVFWIAYRMDVDMSLRSGRLPSVSPTLINFHLPDDTIGEIHSTNDQFKINIFRLHAELAILQAELAEQVQSSSMTRQSVFDCTATWPVDIKLQKWRQNSAFHISVDSLQRALHRSDLVHVTVLEAAYFTSAYVLSAQQSENPVARRRPFSVEGLRDVFSRTKPQQLHADAIRFIALITPIPGENVAVKW